MQSVLLDGVALVRCQLGNTESPFVPSGYYQAQEMVVGTEASKVGEGEVCGGGMGV